MLTSKCRMCGRQITFVKTMAGKPMPVEVRQEFYRVDANGRDTFITGGGKVVRGKIVGPNDEPDGFAWIPHWGHCPKANQIRHAHKAVKAAKERKEPVFVCEQMTFEGVSK